MNLKFVLFSLLITAGLAVSAQIPTIHTTVSTGQVCAGDSISVTFATSDTFIADNVFVIELSDSTGSFATPDTLAVVAGQSGSTVKVATPSVNGSTGYAIVVTASDSVATSDTATLTIKTQLGAPNANLSYSNTSLCSGTDSIRIKVDTLAGFTYTWYLNDTVKANAHPYYFTAKKAGRYGVFLNDTSATACSSGFDSVVISLHSFPPKPTISTKDSTKVCTGTSAKLTSNADSTLSFQWTNHGVPIFGANSTTYQASTSGVYGLVVSNSGCSVSSKDSIKITSKVSPVDTFQLPADSFCILGPTITLTGGTPAGGKYTGNFVSNSIFQPTQSGPGTFTVYYVLTDTNGCKATDSATLNIYYCGVVPSVATQVSPTAVCPGSKMKVTITTSVPLQPDNIFVIELSDTGGNLGSPTILDTVYGQYDTTVSITVPSVTGSSHYKVTVVSSDPAGIAVPATLNIKKILPPPNVHLTYYSDTLCQIGNSFYIPLHIDSLPHVTYTWYFQDTAITNPHPYYYKAQKQGEYLVKFSDTTASGCSTGSDSVFIGVHPYAANPTIGAVGATSICGSGTVLLNILHQDTTNVTYQWLNGQSPIAGATGNTYTASGSGNYSLLVRSQFGCGSPSLNTINVNILSIPVDTLNLAVNTFCLHGPPIGLSGGTPTGGYYSGNFVTGNTFIPSESGLGTFKVFYTIVDSIGCHSTDSATITISDCVSDIAKTSSEPSINIYPNPASGMVTISTGQSGIVNLHVLNVVGQEVSQQIFEYELHYSIDKLPAGTYLLDMTNNSQSWHSVKKLVVE